MSHQGRRGGGDQSCDDGLSSATVCARCPDVTAPFRTIRLRVPQDCEWAFPGEAESKPLQNIKRFREVVQAKANLPAIRSHDLRHTFASLLVSGDMTLPIGKLLGHTQVHTTQRCAHEVDDPLRAGLEQVGDMERRKLKLIRINAMA